MKKLLVRISILSISFLLSFFLFGCSSISVTQDYDPGYDFSKIKTFGFIPIPADAGIDQINAQRLGDAIKTNLMAKGYSTSDKPDIGVALFFSKSTKTSVQSYGYGYGYGYGWRGYGSPGGVDVYQYDEGTLIIDLIDMADNKLVWRGAGTGTVADNPNIEERTARINEAVTSILEKFPPTAEK